MSKTLDEIRKKLQAMDTRSAGNSSADKTAYRHWDIPTGSMATLRFLPDGNVDNTFFWVEKQTIKLTFPGIIGHNEHKEAEVVVPCIEMWDGKNTCPILNEVRPMWRGDEQTKSLAQKYWVKRSYYMQGFVKQDPINDPDTPENPIRRFMINSTLFNIIKSALLDPDMEHTPVDYVNGTDFIIAKTTKGAYADYATSKWARKESGLDGNMLAAIEKYGLVDLSTYLPKRPSADQMTAMFEMFQASLEGEMYDPARWAQSYKPYGFDGSSTGTSNYTRPTNVSKPVVAEEAYHEHNVTPTTRPAVTTSGDTPAAPRVKTAQELLAELRRGQQ